MTTKSTAFAFALVLAATLSVPLGAAFAQTTGTAPAVGTASPSGTPNAGSAGAGTSAVNGIPQGPASGGGSNNSINDPSGIGNAAKVPAPRTAGTKTNGN
jgi:hypothetical protein